VAVSLYDILRPTAIAGGLGVALGSIETWTVGEVLATIMGGLIVGVAAAWIIGLAANRIFRSSVPNSQAYVPTFRSELAYVLLYVVTFLGLIAAAAIGGHLAMLAVDAA
jgi:hypothetical protein